MPVEERDATRASGERETTTGRTTSETTTPSAFKKRGGTTRANARKRAKESESDDANESDHDDDNEPERARKRRQGGIAASSREVKGGAYERFAFEGTRAVGARGDMGATAQLEINTAKEMDGRTMREQVLRQAVERADGFEDDKKYRGTNAYVDYRAGFRREQTIASEKGRGAHGPMRAATNVRSTFVMDYKPDICKDYKQTGFCGWGDACKFLHDRGDYKQGWQLDRDWELKEKARKAAEAKMAALGEDGAADNSEEELENDLPESCSICNTPWLDAKFPVATSCGHCFCERCALQHNAKDTTCFTCGKDTGGTFNAAKDIIKRVKECKATGRAWRERRKSEKRLDDKPASNSAGWVLG
ncbi:hypothetical protein BE221DRAFT_195005 [Ostreococcus tauri]|uniref:Zinc finger, RING/FYVE/PHD-type n=1 Tax=Ostreococcus tauri TaxID=70448 RepID=A0A1Y5I0D2_OSTTA|nr:hypothetical protein BE221DRAFT_195005 [Ostreococcus tauri]